MRSLMQDSSSQDQEALHEKKKLNRQNPGSSFLETGAATVPVHFTTSIGAVESSQSISPVSQGPRGSDSRAMLGIHPMSWSGIQSFTTGLSTERSSICSWRDDEFDRANTQRVCELFSDVDELLYEGKQSSRTLALLEECKEWNGHSPHLRILGYQLEAPKQEGFQYFHRRATNTRTTLFSPPLDTWSDSRELRIEGQKVLPALCDLRCSSSIRNFLSIQPHSLVLEEEVYEVEGRIEEFFAYDAKEVDEEGADLRRPPGAERSGVPPVSPCACIRDAVTGEVFDDVWREVVHMLEVALLLKHWESELTDGVTHVGTSESRKAGSDSVSRIYIKTLSGPVSRGSDTRSMSLWPNIIPQQGSRVSSALKSSLNGVMTIQAKPLQQRQHGFGEKSQYDPDYRPGAPILSGKRLPQLMEHTVLPASRGVCVFPQKTPAHRGLPKLSSEIKPSRGHNVRRGPRLSAVIEGLVPPALNLVQNKRFPTVRSDILEQELSIPTSRVIQLRGKVLHSRVGSAMHPVSGPSPLREPTLVLESLTRPNTTHTFRSDTPIRRFFTPNDIANAHMHVGRGSAPGEPSHIGVTGVSMGIACPTVNSLSECSSTQRRQFNPSSYEEEESEGLLPLGTCHQRKTFCRMHSKKKLHVAMS